MSWFFNSDYSEKPPSIIGSRFEPSSRTFLISEQLNPWELFHSQDKASRHRGAEPCRRYGRSDSTILLSPE